MDNNDLLAEIVSKYGQYRNPNSTADPFTNLNSAGTFVSSLANGAGAGATMTQDQLDQARYYMLKAYQDAGIQGKVNPEDSQWLQLAGNGNYGYTKDSVLDAAKRHILQGGQVNPQDIAVLNAFNSGPDRWANQAGTFAAEAAKYGASPDVIAAGHALGFRDENPFDGKDYYDKSIQDQIYNYAQQHPGWTPVQSTWKPTAPSVGVGAGSYAGTINPYPETPTPSTGNSGWTTSTPASTTMPNSGQTSATSSTSGIQQSGQTASPTFTGNTYNPYTTGFAGNNGTQNGTQVRAPDLNSPYPTQPSTSLEYAQRSKKDLQFIS